MTLDDTIFEPKSINTLMDLIMSSAFFQNASISLNTSAPH